MGLEVTKEKPKINALLIARKQYKNLLNPLYKDYDISIRKIIGKKKSLSVLIERLNNYLQQTFFVIDINAVSEKGEDLAELLTVITKKRDDVRLVLFAPEAKPGNKELDYLVRQGFTNIAANSANNPKEKWNRIIADICLFFEGQGLPSERVCQLVNPKPNPQIIALSDCEEEKKPDKTLVEDDLKAKKAEKEEAISIPNYSKTYTEIDFYGAQKRIGTTYAALLTAAYFVKGKASPIVVLGSKREYDRLTAFYDNKTVISNCITEINGICITFCDAPADNLQEFNIVIKDKGVFRELDEKKSMIVIVGGVNYNEIANTFKVYQSLNAKNINYISMVSFAEEKPDSLLPGKGAVIIPYASDMTVFPESAAAVFNSAFGGLA